METLPRKYVPYPLHDYQGLFLTFLYGKHDAEKDYRYDLIEAGLPLLKKQGYSGIGVVAGREAPYPNGPADLFARTGFQQRMVLDRVILRYRWEEQGFMVKAL